MAHRSSKKTSRIFFALISSASITCTNSYADISMDIDLSTEEQVFDNGDTTIKQLSLTPAFATESFFIWTTLPYYDVEGTRFILSPSANHYLLCKNKDALNNYPLLQALANKNCQSETKSFNKKISGWGDIQLGSTYFFPSHNSMEYSLSSQVKIDSGEEQLTSNTQELGLDFTADFVANLFILTGTIGHQYFIGGESKDFYNNYWFGSLGWQTNNEKPLNVALRIDYQENSIENADPLTTYYASISYLFDNNIQLSFYGTDYHGQPWYPEYSLGIGLTLYLKK